MSNQIIFTKSVLDGTNKVGKLKADADGYYLMTLGAFNAFNASGIYYDFNAYLKKMFAQGSLLRERLKNGRLRGEIEHPARTPGMTDIEYFSRLRMIDSKNTSCHFKDFIVTESKDHEGRPVMRVDGLVKPSGVHGNQLAEQLKNAEENVCFSVRSLVKRYPMNGKLVNSIFELITYDQVNDPGIGIATKYTSTGLESASSDLLITPELLISADENDQLMIGNENAPLLSTTMIRSALGWQKVQTVNPSAMNW